MSVYYLKPIVWNTKNYRQPSGGKFKSGCYPAEHGFGHEEWNNSPRLTFEKNGERFRVFNTDRGFGKQPLDAFAGDIFVFMIAFNDDEQYLVGVAGGATSLLSNPDERERLMLLNAKGQEEAWAVQNVKSCYDDDRKAFRDGWNWKPTWKCPAHLFLWLTKPLLLNPTEITGKNRLIMMYSAYQEISQIKALNILTQIEQQNDSDILENLKARCSTDELDVITDITQIHEDDTVDATTKESLVQSRLGQGRFRQNLMGIWDNSCAVTGCAIPELLRASHIKPWHNSTNRQRLDPHNGLLLEANLDALFDSGLISFEDNGDMLVSTRLTPREQKRLKIPSQLRIELNSNQQGYLTYHRDKVFTT